MAYLLWTCGSGLYQGGHLANSLVHRFHQELNAGQYEQICQEADAGFSESDTHDNLIQFLRGVHTKLGNATAENLTNLTVNANTNGTFVVTTYSSTFANGTAVETFTWAKKGTGLKLYGYHVESKAFIVE
ncbi:MAG: DUF4019 domain-containing protein [Candidatus Acidiferrales bacterium]